MSFDLDDRNSSNSMIVKDILNEFPFDKSEIKDNQKESGGIPLSRVVDLEKHEKLLPVLKCKICLNILQNPYDCSKCGNTFCYNCINKLKESMNKCPYGCVDYEIMPSSFAIKKFLEQLNFTCLNKDNGCKEIISYNNLEQHDKNCNYINVVCPNSQCSLKIRWNLLNNHLQNECLYTIYECQKCHMKLNRKEYLTHTKICGIINKEFDKQSPRINKLTKEEIEKNSEIFNNVMNCIENFPPFSNDKNENNLNIFMKSLVFCLCGKISMVENEINKINSTLQQFNESNLIFYKSINDELENINEKISNSNLNESSVDHKKISKKSSSEKFNSNELFDFCSPKNLNNNKAHKKTIFPFTSNNLSTGDKFMLINPRNLERQDITKGFDKLKETYQKKLLSSSKNKKKSKNKDEFYDSNIITNNILNHNEAKDKNKNSKKKGTTITTLKTKEKFIKGMRSTKYMEKLKGIQPKKQNYTYSNYNTEEVSSNDNINNNNINDPNYLTTNTFNTINGAGFNKINNKNNPKITTLKEKILKEKDKNNEKDFNYICNNQEIILDKIENLEKVMLNAGNYNNEFLNSFNNHKHNSLGLNNNSVNIQQSESSKSNFQKNQS